MCTPHVYADTNANINVGESVGMVSNGNQGTESSGHGNKNTTSSSGSSYHSTQAELNANNEKQSALDAIKKWKDLASSMDETKNGQKIGMYVTYDVVEYLDDSKSQNILYYNEKLVSNGKGGSVKVDGEQKTGWVSTGDSFNIHVNDLGTVETNGSATQRVQ